MSRISCLKLLNDTDVWFLDVILFYSIVHLFIIVLFD